MLSDGTLSKPLMAEKRLILFPKQAESTPVTRAMLVDWLSDTGLIGEPCRTHPHCYRSGPKFMSAIMFIGCSPVVRQDEGPPESGEAACVYCSPCLPLALLPAQAQHKYWIEVPEPRRELTLIGVHPELPAFCPTCGEGAFPARDKPEGADQVHTCEGCGCVAELFRWDWRRQAGFGQNWINIWGVHAGEALPSEYLLGELSAKTGSIWDYAYCRA